MSIPEVEVRHTRQTRYAERRGVSGRSVIEEAKAKVATIDLADRLCGPGQMRRVGKEWAALCPLPDHEERTPSFTVDPAKDVWFCHGCLRGGDVITLAQRAWDIDRADVAAAEVLLTFGHPIPDRSPAWFRKEERQATVRNIVREAIKSSRRRRFFRWVILPTLEGIADEEERRAEIKRTWAQFEAMMREEGL
jgi:CHC2 zinc finger